MKFDTTLFKKNDPQLAKQVEKLSVFFEGVNDVKISWIDAKVLVKKYSYYLKQIKALASVTKPVGLSENEFYRVYDYIKARLNECNGFRWFMQIVKAANRIYGNVILE